jgi:hypothetical protein
MTRPDPVRFLRTEATMAYPEGRLLASQDGIVHVLAPDGWSKLGSTPPSNAQPLSRRDAAVWCERRGWEIGLLDAVPHLL